MKVSEQDHMQVGEVAKVVLDSNVFRNTLSSRAFKDIRTDLIMDC